MRFAVGDVGRLLADNPLTRGWKLGLDRHVITPIEMKAVGEKALMEERYGWPANMGLRIAMALPEDGRFTPRMGRATEMLLGGPMDDYVSASIRRSPEWVPDREALVGYVGNMLQNEVAEAQPSYETMVKASQLLADGVNSHTPAGQMVRLAALNPLAAYTAVGTGGALATAGLLKAWEALHGGRPADEDEVVVA